MVWVILISFLLFDFSLHFFFPSCCCSVFSSSAENRYSTDSPTFFSLNRYVLNVLKHVWVIKMKVQHQLGRESSLSHVFRLFSVPTCSEVVVAFCFFFVRGRETHFFNSTLRVNLRIVMIMGKMCGIHNFCNNNKKKKQQQQPQLNALL